MPGSITPNASACLLQDRPLPMRAGPGMRMNRIVSGYGTLAVHRRHARRRQVLRGGWVGRSSTDHRIVVAGAGYAGLHVALRLATKLRDNPGVELTLVDRHDYHQAITELPRVAGGTRA